MTKFKQGAIAAGLILVVFVAGGAVPAASDRDLIIRLQGEITVLQRQIRDLQETIDRNHATSSQVISRMAESTETSGKTISTLADRINQGDSLQQNNLTGVVRRLTQLEENVSQANSQLIEVSRTLRDIKVNMQRPAPQKPEN